MNQDRYSLLENISSQGTYESGYGSGVSWLMLRQHISLLLYGIVCLDPNEIKWFMNLWLMY